jgi:heme/copper-type cytochrome/quinol oxidase subunit 3
MLAGERMSVTKGLIATITYGAIFTLVQGYEYNVATFSINDGIFGSLFFLLTGFHGIHGSLLVL